MISFKKWQENYEQIYKIEFEKWMQKSGKQVKNGKPVVLPSEIEEYVLAQYIAYNNEVQTRKLVFATWVLAISSIILSVITLILK